MTEDYETEVYHEYDKLSDPVAVAVAAFAATLAPLAYFAAGNDMTVGFIAAVVCAAGARWYTNRRRQRHEERRKSANWGETTKQEANEHQDNE